MKYKLFYSLLFLPFVCFGAPKNVSKTWLEFVKAQKEHKPSLLLDFSFAGYHHAEEGIPTVNAQIFNVCDYGAIPNDGKSDREAFEKAIKAAEKNGSGVIFFPKGQYHLRPEDAPNTPIYIKGSHIVVRGEGSGNDGTDLFMEYPNPTTDPKKLYGSPSLISVKGEAKRNKITPIVANAERGSFTVKVASNKGIKVGDWICLTLKNNDPKLVAEELHPYCVEDKWTDLTNNGVQINDYHQVVKVDGNLITLKEPIMHAIDQKWGWNVCSYTHLEEIGFENLTFRGNWHDKFKHHRSWLDDGGYKPLQIQGVVNSWVRNCRFMDVNEGLTVSMSANVSVINCVIDGTMGHSAMRAQGSSRVFFGNIEDRPAQWHSVGFSKPSMGTVLWRIKTNANSCFESHASQPRASLLDECEGGFMRGRAGGAIGSNPNHLGDLFFWNYKELDEKQENFDFWAKDTPYWRFLPPVFVGFHGAGTTFKQDEVRLDESHGEPVSPASLYEAQLKLRLGKLPRWFVELKAQSEKK